MEDNYTLNSPSMFCDEVISRCGRSAADNFRMYGEV